MSDKITSRPNLEILSIKDVWYAKAGAGLREMRTSRSIGWQATFDNH